MTEETVCIYCGDLVHRLDLICSDKCQREHFGMGDEPQRIGEPVTAEGASLFD